jgi:hypothetical protein
MRLLDHARDIHTQCGEDGILAKVLETLGAQDRWCVEFGAWDGQHLSNTAHLIETQGYSAVLIEGSRQRFGDLTRRYAGNPKVTPLNCFVGFTAADGLDTLLAGTPIPRDFDLLSIDIDGNDYHVWEAVKTYTPKVVCIEYNPTMATEVDFVQAADPNVSQGSSLLALVRLGRQKGYELVACTAMNAIFVRAQYFPLFGIADNRPSTLREESPYVTHLFTGYDGTLFVRGHARMLWHDIGYAGRLRQLPRPLRRFPGNFRFLRWRTFTFYKAVLKLLGRG